MTAQSILDAALLHFARDGYEGASLRAIAEDVGIKKPSIYAHFSGKDDLFLRLVKRSIEEEYEAMLSFIAEGEGKSIEHLLRGLIERQRIEFESSEVSKFLLRTSYFPPQSLYEEITEIVELYLVDVERFLTGIIRQWVQEKKLPPIDPEMATIAYLTLTDGLNVELLYGGPNRFQRRVAAAWPIFWRGLMTETLK